VGLTPTGSQTVGPFFGLGLDWPGGAALAGAQTPGERIAIEGRVLDGDGAPVPDAMIEIWQANHEGRYAHPEDRQNKPLDPAFTGFGRTGTDAAGRFGFRTIRPGAVPAPAGGLQAPHIVVGVFARGLLKRLVTRIYFADDPANLDDPVLALVPAERRATLVAQPVPGTAGHYRWNIVLQGEGETVFFDS
jgi:protocatechuate 3,4-dioxygenase, alpha subunit